jgi:hypothetical protein
VVLNPSSEHISLIEPEAVVLSVGTDADLKSYLRV